MTWWTAAASLTPIAAWDANRVSGSQMLDAIGTNNITATSAINVKAWGAKGVLGNSNLMSFAAGIPKQTNGVIAAYYTIRRRNVLISTPGYNDRFVLHQNAEDLKWYTQNGSPSPYITDTEHRNTFPMFAAIVISGASSVMYFNGNWFGIAVASSYIPSSLGQIGYYQNGNEHNLDSDEHLHALGFFDGTPTLEDMQTLEAAARSELAGTPTGTRNLAPSMVSIGYPPPQATRGGNPPAVIRDYTLGRRSQISSGPGIITGTVKEKTTPVNTPLHRRVQLIDQRKSIPLQEVWSDAATGIYSFTGLDVTIPYTVIAFDYNNLYRAVIADNLYAEAPQ